MDNLPAQPGTASALPAGSRPASAPVYQESDGRVPCQGGHIAVDLVVPPAPQGLVVFIHGTGSSRRSARNLSVAAQVQAAGFATLALDLLTLEEARADTQSGMWRFDLPLFTHRLVEVTRWARQHPRARRLSIGFFGASTGGVVALVAAAQLGPLIRAVVSRGGLLNLSGQVLPLVSAPTLLIAGGADEAVLKENRGALVRLRCTKELAVVPAAAHLFDEPGAIEQVGDLATRWFVTHLPARIVPA